jgi:anti-sigma regulatory factor (Ser/Thr protein kinase)
MEKLPDPDSAVKSIEDDLELCRQIQRAMIPGSLPRVEGIEATSLYFPCGALGGDLFDMIQISEDVFALYMFDVAAHGVQSALFSAIAKVSFSGHIRMVNSPRAVIERVNAEMLSGIKQKFYLTAFVAYLDLHNNRLTYCNAGHPAPFIYRRKENAIIPLDSASNFIGVFNDGRFQDDTVYLFPGDLFLLFTDGFFGLFSDKNELEGRRELERFFLNSQHQSFQELAADCRCRCEKILDLNTQKDDITALFVEILTQSRKDQIKEKLGFAKDDPVYLQFISYYEEMDNVAGVILKDMDAFSFPDESIRRMKITLMELMANAIGHGNGEDHSKKAIIGHNVNSDSARIAIMDEGEGFDPGLVPNPTLPENLVKDHGRGLYIVKNYVNEIKFNAKGNRVYIMKNRAES